MRMVHRIRAVWHGEHDSLARTRCGRWFSLVRQRRAVTYDHGTTTCHTCHRAERSSHAPLSRL
jgi:hypothetical protein